MSRRLNSEQFTDLRHQAQLVVERARIVMDVSMPVLDGIEATRPIKASETTRDARVIAPTANSPLDRRLTQTLFAAVLQMPASPDIVLATVQRLHVCSPRPA